MTLPTQRAPPDDSPDDPVDDSPTSAAAPMSLLQHLDELRRRLTWASIGIAMAFFACWWQADALLAWCQAPYIAVAGKPLAVMAVAEAFFVKVRVAFVVALFASSPWTAWQVWCFVAPGLYKKERRLAIPFIVLVSVFFTAGGAFGYYVGLPAMLKFLLGPAATGFELVIRADSYISMLGRLLIGMGLVFEAPVLTALLARMGLVSSRFLVNKLRHATVIIFIVAAFITPSGDIPTLLVFALPMLVLYAFSIGVAFVFERPKAAAP